MVLGCTKTNEPSKTITQVVNHKKDNRQWVVLNLAEDMTLTELAHLTGKSEKDILKWNPNLKGRKLYAGMGIGLRLTPKEERLWMDNSFLRGVKHDVHGSRVQKVISYKVRGNETVEYLVKKFRSDPLLIGKMNDPTKLSIMAPGTILKIPVLKRERPKRQKIQHQGIKIITYRVKASETAWGISRKYKISLRTLKEFNPGMDLNNIARGTLLKIPVKKKRRSSGRTKARSD